MLLSSAGRVVFGDLALVLLLRLLGRLGLLGLLRLLGLGVLLVVGMEDTGGSINRALVVSLGHLGPTKRLLELLLLLGSHGVPHSSVLGFHDHQASSTTAIASVGVDAGSDEEGKLGNKDDPDKGGIGNANRVESADVGGRGVDAVVVFFVVARAVWAVVVARVVGNEGGPESAGAGSGHPEDQVHADVSAGVNASLEFSGDTGDKLGAAPEDRHDILGEMLAPAGIDWRKGDKKKDIQLGFQ